MAARSSEAEARDAKKTKAFIERMKSGATKAQATTADPPEPLDGWPDEITLAELWKRTGGKLDRSQELIKDLWLERGGGVFWVSSSGTGKSVMCLQVAYAFALGRPFFQMAPARPLRIAIIQSEDSVNEVTKTQRGMRAGYTSEDGAAWTADDVAAAEKTIHFWNAGGATGAMFVAWLGEKLKEYAEAGRRIDLVFVNPFTSFYGGELNSQKEVDAFLKNGQACVDAVIKAPDISCGLVFFHHTAKPAGSGGGKNRGGYTDKEGYLEYIGSGSSAITNWARAVLVFLKHGDGTKKLFDLHATKRGDLLGWTDEDGNPVEVQYARHAKYGELAEGERLPFWIGVPKSELEEAESQAGENEAERLTRDATTLAELIKSGKTMCGNVRHVATAGTVDQESVRLFKHKGKRGSGEHAKAVAALLKENYANFGLEYFGTTYKRSTFKFYGTPDGIRQLQIDRPWEPKGEDA